VDFSWVRELAEQANQLEVDRQEDERLKLEEARAVAVATIPFVEKLYMLLNTCTEEFNKHMHYPHLRVTMSRFQKKTRGQPYGGTDPNYVNEEIAYFTFTRRSWMFGVRGINGLIDFVEFPVTEGAGALNMKLDELGIEGVYKLKASLDRENKQVLWTMHEQLLDGPKLILLCQDFFSTFIQRTNVQS
jgi:hypothetical protein